MSIIYDALKKVEKFQNTTPSALTTQTKSKGRKVKIFLLYGLVVVFGFFATKIFFGLFIKPLSNITTSDTVKNQAQFDQEGNLVSKKEILKEAAVIQENIPLPPSVSKPPEPQKENLPTLVLNGVFFSQDEGYVLINNRILKEGDEINGAIIKSISLNEVELESNGSTIKLSNKK